MSNKAILDMMAKQADKLSIHINRLKGKESVHEMDIDFLADRLKEMYSASLDLETTDELEEEISNINDLSTDQHEEIPSTGSEVGLPIADEPAPEEGIDDSSENDTPTEDETEIKAEVPVPEPAVDEQTVEDLIEQPFQKETSPEEVPQVKAEDLGSDPVADEKSAEENNAEEELPPPKTTADLFSGTTTIADSFMKGEDKTIAARAVPQEVGDLKMAIGINDKFLFINELFKGDPNAYNEAIDQLNGGNDHADARAVLENFRSEFEWPDNSEAYHRLKKIVHAKYPEL
jgi:hypothetical protein